MAKPDATGMSEATGTPKAPGTPSTQSHGEATAQEATAKRTLSPEAERALAEAEARRAAQAQSAAQSAAKDAPKTANEIGGRQGPDPVRFGDWEKNGIISDF